MVIIFSLSASQKPCLISTYTSVFKDSTWILLLPWKDFPGGSDGKASAYNAETQVQPLGWEGLLEKEMATHSSIVAWKIP